MKRIGRIILISMLCVLGLGVNANSASAKGGCSSWSGRARYIICIDISSQTGSLRRVSNGSVGSIILGPYTVTTSRVDTGAHDSITKMGHFIPYQTMRYSYSGLEYFIRFYGGQGLHAYPHVGGWYDSHGCVRQYYWVAKSLWKRLVTGSEGNLVAQGRVEIHIYP